MTDAEISRRLALAIGYLPEHVRKHHNHCAVWRERGRLNLPFPGWYVFDYRDPAVIWPIAERFKCFPDHCEDVDGRGIWNVGKTCRDFVYADTAAKAVALAVINGSEVKK